MNLEYGLCSKLDIGEINQHLYIQSEWEKVNERRKENIEKVVPMNKVQRKPQTRKCNFVAKSHR